MKPRAKSAKSERPQTDRKPLKTKEKVGKHRDFKALMAKPDELLRNPDSSLNTVRKPTDERKQTPPIEETIEHRTSGDQPMITFMDQARPLTTSTQPAAPNDVQTMNTELVERVVVFQQSPDSADIALQLKVSGSTVHVRVRQRRHGVEVRFRSKDPSMKHELRASSGDLRSALEASGVNVHAVVVR